MFFITDLGGFALATLVSVVLLVLPGFGLVRLLRSGGLTLPSWSGAMLGLVLLPVVDALCIRYGGLPLAIALRLVLAVAGLSSLRPALPIVTRPCVAIVVLWWSVVAWANVDIDTATGLHQPLTILDMVKHAAVVRTIADYGLPLRDPFMARDGAAGYYHYFYLGPALVARLCGVGADARTAFMAASFVAGIGFVAMLLLLAQRAGYRLTQRLVMIIVMLCVVSGLDVIPATATAAGTGTTLAQLDWWGDEVRWVLTSMLWVPHHLTAVIAIMGAVILHEAGQPGRPIVVVVAVACALASAFGMSVWVAIAAAPILALWWLGERRRHDAASLLMKQWWLLPAAGLAALILSLPQFSDLLASRDPSVMPMGLHLRSFGNSLEYAWPVRLVLLPFGYLLDFGIFGVGAIGFLTTGGWREARSVALGRFMLIGAGVSVMLVSCVQSTIIYNDFGWRAIWFAQVPALLWTARYLAEQRAPQYRRIARAFIALGAVATVWDLIGLRLVRPPQFTTGFAYLNDAPAIDRDLRTLYGRLSRTLPHDRLVQHDPAAARRVFDFGLYGAHRPYVADREANLFGASRSSVVRRMADVAPIFAAAIPLVTRLARARALGIDALVYTQRDPAWPAVSSVCTVRLPTACVVNVGGMR